MILPPGRMPEAITGVPPATLRPGRRTGGRSWRPKAKPGGLQDILPPRAGPDGLRFPVLQEEHHPAAHRTPDGTAPHLGHWPEYGEPASPGRRRGQPVAKDLLINVTAFFRDAEAFEELRQQGHRAAGRRPSRRDEPLRVWVAGCSSGEEAYSLAMLLMEEVAAARKNCPVQVFATDIDEEALQFARAGIYPESIAPTWARAACEVLRPEGPGLSGQRIAPQVGVFAVRRT